MMKLASVGDIVVASSSMGDVGIMSWDFATGADHSTRPHCACPRNGLVLVGQRYLAASQIQRAGSVGSGEIIFWALNKSRLKLTEAARSYPVEPIIPLACTTDGVYLAGGGLSGKLYLWEVSTWSCLIAWAGHQKPVTCLVFSDDDSLLISGAEDGVIYVWSILRLFGTVEQLHVTQNKVNQDFVYCWIGHGGPITAVLSSSGGANAIIVSSSLDRSCKLWSLALGRLLKSIEFQSPINCVILDPGEQSLYAGTSDGKVVIRSITHWPSANDAIQLDSLSIELSAHRQAVTTLTFAMDGQSLVSASLDGTIHIWDVIAGTVVKELSIRGPVTNLLVIPEADLSGFHRDFEHHLQKGQLAPVSFEAVRSAAGLEVFDVQKDPVMVLPASFQFNGEAEVGHSYSASCLLYQVDELEQESTPAAVQLQFEEMKEKRAQALRIKKQYLKQNKILARLSNTVKFDCNFQ